MGEILTQKLQEHGYKISYILDQYYKNTTYNEIPVFSLKQSQELKKNELIIITPIVNSEKIGRQLTDMGFCTVVNIRDLLRNVDLKKELEGL